MIKVLSGLFVAQIVLALILGVGSNEQNFAKEKLLPVGITASDKLVIADGDTSLTLKKNNQQWGLPAVQDFPASETLISKMLGDLSKLEVSWPVGKTSRASKQFNVTEDTFERKLELYQGETLVAKLYLGSAPSFKKVYVRVDGTHDTYEVNYASHQASVDISYWLDKQYFEQPVADIETISFSNGIKLKRSDKDDSFILVGVNAETEEPVAKEIKKLVQAMTNITFKDILTEKEYAEKLKTAKEPRSVEFTRKDGKKTRFIVKNIDDKEYILSSSNSPYKATVPDLVYSSLNTARRALIVAKQELKAESAEETIEPIIESTTPSDS